MPSISMQRQLQAEMILLASVLTHFKRHYTATFSSVNMPRFEIIASLFHLKVRKYRAYNRKYRL